MGAHTSQDDPVHQKWAEVPPLSDQSRGKSSDAANWQFMQAKALLVDIFCHKEQWSFTASDKLQRSPQQWGECCSTSSAGVSSQSAPLHWCGKELGKVHPGLLQEKQETPDEREKDNSQSCVQQSRISPSFLGCLCLMNKSDTSEWILQLIAMDSSMTFPFEASTSFPISLLTCGGKRN